MSMCRCIETPHVYCLPQLHVKSVCRVTPSRREHLLQTRDASGATRVAARCLSTRENRTGHASARLRTTATRDRSHAGTQNRRAPLCEIPVPCSPVRSLALTLLADATSDHTRGRRGDGCRRDERGGTRSGSVGLVRRLTLPNSTVVSRLDLCPMLPYSPSSPHAQRASRWRPEVE